jgi:quinohemoprotein amine dehydrogenase beta subunit
VRSFPAPRGISALLPSTDGKTMYAVGWEIYAFDTKTGMIRKTIGLRHWDRPNFASPDALVMWPNYSQSNVFVSPYFTVRTDKKPGEPGFAITGVMTLDLKTGQHRFVDYEDTEVLIFSMIMNPVRRNEVYGTYTTMSKVDLDARKLVKRFNQKHTYYTVNVSSDGKELYAGGTMDDIAVFDTQTMDQIGSIMIPGGGDMGASSMRMISRPALSE